MNKENNANGCNEKLGAAMRSGVGPAILSGGALGCAGMAQDQSAMEPRRPSLMESIESQLHRATGEVRKAEQLHELQYLLQKNPDVARILDLIEVVRR